MTDKRLHKISDVAAAWLAGWWFSDNVTRGLGDPTPAQQREFERQVQQSMRKKSRSTRRAGLRKMGPYKQTERNDTYFRKIPVENAVQAELVKFAIGNQRLSVPPFLGARFDPTSHRWVKPENMGRAIAARGGKKRVRSTMVGSMGSRSIGGHGKGHERFSRLSIRGRESAKEQRQQLLQRLKHHEALMSRKKSRGKIRKSADQIAMEEYYFLLKETNEAKEFAQFSKAALLDSSVRDKNIENYNLQTNPALIPGKHSKNAHTTRHDAVANAFWDIHASKRGIDRASTPQERFNAKKVHDQNIEKLCNAVYAFNSGKYGQNLDAEAIDHTYNHGLHHVTHAPFAEHYRQHIRNLPVGAVYASAYPPPKDAVVKHTTHGAAYWFPHNKKDDRTQIGASPHEKDYYNSDEKDRPKGQMTHENMQGQELKARQKRIANENALNAETWGLPQRGENEKNDEAYDLGLQAARKHANNTLVVNRGTRNEYTYYGETDRFPLKEDVDAGKTDLAHIRAPDGYGLVKYASGNITAGLWRKGSLLQGYHMINPANRQAAVGTKSMNDRIAHEDATIQSRLTGLGNLTTSPAGSNTPAEIRAIRGTKGERIGSRQNVSPAELRRYASGVKYDVGDQDVPDFPRKAVDINKEYNPFVGLDILIKTNIEKFKRS